MAISRRSMMLGSAAGGAALTLAACGGADGGDNGNGGGGNGGGGGGGVIQLNGTEPQNPLHTLNTNEVGGGRNLNNLYSKPIHYTPARPPGNEMAESIESEDRQHITITIADG